MSPLPRFHKLDETKREAILVAAAQEFGDRGYDGASLNRMLGTAGLSKGAFYYYFEDKEDLFVTVLRAFDTHIGAEALQSSSLTKETFWPAFGELLARTARVLAERPEFLGLGRAFYSIPNERWFEGTLGVYLSERLADFHDQLARGQELGVVRADMPPDVLVEAWMGVSTVVDRWLIERLEDADATERERLLATQLDMMKRVLLPAPRTEDPR